MAGKGTGQEAIAAIEALKSVARCKIIKNVGDFAFLIDATIPGTSVLVKFQLTADYPTAPPSMFIRHPSLSKGEVQKVIATIPEGTNSLVELFETIQHQLLEYQLPEGLKPKERSPTSSRTKKMAELDPEDGKVSSKKPSMRTAADVIKRIQWDSGLDSSAFIVGYIDRFLGIQEQPFTAFNWVNPAEADWMDLNIPEHRIEYFKHRDRIVWEKKSRIDDVFGSTGGMTIDQLLSQEADDSYGKNDQQGTPPAEPITQAPAPNSPIKNTSHTLRPMRKHTGSSSDDAQRRGNDRPNHFVAIPVKDSDCLQALAGIQDEYLTLAESDGERYMKEPHNMHITLCAVRVNNDNDLDRVTQALYELVMDRQLQQQFQLGRLADFYGRVLYASAQLNEEFHSFVLQLRKSLVEMGIRVYDSLDEFTPHITLLNFPRASDGNIHLPIETFLAIKADSKSDVLNSITVPLEQLAIYSMERDESNHYLEKNLLDVRNC